jgi:hypothetical protein
VQVSKREEAVKNVSRELLKANDVIKKLQEQNRKLNQKVKNIFKHKLIDNIKIKKSFSIDGLIIENQSLPDKLTVNANKVFIISTIPLIFCGSQFYIERNSAFVKR